MDCKLAFAESMDADYNSLSSPLSFAEESCKAVERAEKIGKIVKIEVDDESCR